MNETTQKRPLNKTKAFYIIAVILILFIVKVVIPAVKNWYHHFQVKTVAEYDVMDKVLRYPKQAKNRTSEILLEKDLNRDGLKDYIVHVNLDAKNALGGFKREEFLVRIEEGKEGGLAYSSLPPYIAMPVEGDLEGALQTYVALFQNQ